MHLLHIYLPIILQVTLPTPLKSFLCSVRHRAAHLALNKPFWPAITATPKLKTTTMMIKKLLKVSIIIFTYSSIHIEYTHWLGDTSNWYQCMCRDPGFWLVGWQFHSCGRVHFRTCHINDRLSFFPAIPSSCLPYRLVMIPRFTGRNKMIQRRQPVCVNNLHILERQSADYGLSVK